MQPQKPILLVDDSPFDTEMTLRALAAHHLEQRVISVGDGAEALDYLYRRGAFCERAEGQPSVILLDLKMPKVDGLEVLQQIKNDAQLKRIPVVVMTSSSEDADLSKCYELGVNAYVVKPVHFSQFLEAVKMVGAFWAIFNEVPPEENSAAPAVPQV